MNGSDNDQKLAKSKLEQLNNELNFETLTNERAADILARFNKRVNHSLVLLSCGCCGERSWHSTVTHHKCIDELSKFELNEAQQEAYEALGNYKGLSSVYKDTMTHKHYFLHPETVSNDRQVSFCGDCYLHLSRQSVPRYSIMNGHDYGDISRIRDHFPSLKPLRLIEKHLIGRSRLYASIVKLDYDAHVKRILKGHIITFVHDGPEKFAKALPDLSSASQYIKVYFVGPKGKQEHIKELVVRPDVVFEWLKMLRVCNPHYASIPILDDNAELRKQMEDLNSNIMNASDVIDDEVSVRLNNVVSDDIAGIRKYEFDCEEECTEEGQPALSHVFLENQDDMEEHNQQKASYLALLREAFFPDDDEESNNIEVVNDTGTVRFKVVCCRSCFAMEK